MVSATRSASGRLIRFSEPKVSLVRTCRTITVRNRSWEGLGTRLCGRLLLIEVFLATSEHVADLGCFTQIGQGVGDSAVVFEVQ